MLFVTVAYFPFVNVGRVITITLYALFFVESIVLIVLAIVQNITNDGASDLLSSMILNYGFNPILLARIRSYTPPHGHLFLFLGPGTNSAAYLVRIAFAGFECAIVLSESSLDLNRITCNATLG